MYVDQWRCRDQPDSGERCLEWVWDKMETEHCTVKFTMVGTIERESLG